MSIEFRGDWDRQQRTGIPEAVLAESKSVTQLDAIAEAAAGRRLLFTRLASEKHAALAPALRATLDYDVVSRTAVLGGPLLVPAETEICIVAAGTSDAPVAGEALRTLAFHGYGAALVADVGVAGLWRLLEQAEFIAGHRVVIAIAGMEGAIFSVLAGLVDSIIIAVPTSVGYGVTANGTVALHAAIGGCAPGVVAVNIDNGFGAACAAIKMLRKR